MKDFSNAKKLVIKIGSSSLIDNTGQLNLKKIDQLSMVISDLSNRGVNICLVSSGAIGVGMGKMKVKQKPKDMKEKQALASIGQCILMKNYESSFAQYCSTVSQILLTRDIIDDPYKKTNTINTLETLFKRNVIPIINENDTVATEEIEFGDNDTLSAYVSKLIEADLLVMLSNIDGLYRYNPNLDYNKELISSVRHIDETIENLAYGTSSKHGTGGMITKVNAAKIATRAGTDVIVTNGNNPNNIYKILEGEKIGTLFHAKENKRIDEKIEDRLK